MSTRKPISPEKFVTRVHDIWANQWLLLTCGDYSESSFNSMTVGWGSFGTMWRMPFAQVVVRPTRFTYQYMEKYDSFTLCAFPESLRSALSLLGAKSGRDCDKVAESGLTPIESTAVVSPSFEEAELIIECRKIYSDDFDPGRFLDLSIESQYPMRDYHRVYYGEMVAIQGIESYTSEV